MSIVAVVVTYHPEFDVLETLLDALLPQVWAVVVVDNGSGSKLSHWLKFKYDHRVHVVFLDANTGLAAAQNTGVNWARQHGADFVLLFDQDSLPAPDMVHYLLLAFQTKKSMGCNVAAVGPRYLDERQDNPPPFIQIQGLRLFRQTCDDPSSITDVDYLVSSGCLIPVSTFDAVGLMRQDLFIDYVDIEWCLRARRHGFQSYGVCAAKMQHSLGDAPISFFRKSIPLHSPLRHYYQFRNAVLLYREAWVALNWKLVDGWRLCLKYVFYSLFAKPRFSHLQMMTLGVWHGLKGKSGKLEGRAS